MAKRSTKNKGTPWTAEERRFVRDAYPALGPAAIAERLGRSRSGVCGLVRRMKESGEIAAPESVREGVPGVAYGPPPDCPDGSQDTIGCLRWTRDRLARSLQESEPTQAARLAKEYRETVEAIGRMEASEANGRDDALDAIVRGIAERIG